MSFFDDNIENNIVSLENLDEIQDKYLLRAPRKGKLIKGPNWTAYNRENLGTIPRKMEKVLIEDKNNKERLGFSCQTERFALRASSVRNMFPGPGAYQTNKDPVNTTSSSQSTRGFGNGFASVSDRFDDPKFYYDKFLPGPGQYKINDKVSIKSDIDKNIHFKSLYENTKVKSLIIKQERPGPGFYNPILLTNLETRGPLSSFKSNVTRFKREHKSAFPGPGKYNPNKIEEDNKGKTLSYFFRETVPKKQDPLLKYIDQTQMELQFEKGNKIDLKNYSHYSSSKDKDRVLSQESTFYKTSKMTKNGFKINLDYNKNFNMSKKEFFNLINSKYKSKSVSQKYIMNSRARSSFPQTNIKKKTNDFSLGRLVESKKEAEYVNEVLGKNNKKPLFELSPPRWNDKKSNNIPGPAYYDPQKVPTKIDFFNDNMQRWI